MEIINLIGSICSILSFILLSYLTIKISININIDKSNRSVFKTKQSSKGNNNTIAGRDIK